MSLRVWLPLNGNLNNQGASGCNPVQSTAPTYVNGKIGKAMSTGAFYLPAAEVAKFYNNNAMSWCFWIYINGTGTANAPIIGQSNTSAGDCRMYTIYQYPNIVDLHLSWQNETGGNAFCSAILSNAFTANTWNHCAITYNGSTILIYINGILKQTYTNIISSRNNFSYNVPIPNASTRYLNDIRIYDHVLSPKEVKEISKGLVLHYPLTMNGTGKDNIVPGTSPYEVTYTYPSSNFSDKLAATTSIVPSASQYTLSFYAKSTVNGDKARAHWYSPNTTTKCETNQGAVSTASDGNIDFTLSTELKKYWCVYTQSSTTAVKHLIFPRLFYGNGSGTVSVKCVKLEEGSTPTAWKPNSGDALYTTLKYNETTEIDTSGYKYHGTRSGVTYESNSPKYDVSTIFDANADTITLPAILTSGTTIPQMSVSILFKTNTLNSTIPNLLSLGENNFARIRLESATSILYYIKVASTKVSSTYTTKTLTDNVLHQAVFTFNNGIVTMYIDGVQVGTTNHSSTGTSLTMSSTSLHLAGYSANGENFLGNLSDFRIYATALSADDVKELYSSSASITNNGTVMCYEFNEE